MSLTPVQFSLYLSWAVTALGVGLWIWSWLKATDPISKMRFRDCGVVLVFAAVLTRLMIQSRALTVMDWVIILLGPLFIAASLWRLNQSQKTKP